MIRRLSPLLVLSCTATAALPGSAAAHSAGHAHTAAAAPTFDVTSARVAVQGRGAQFRMTVRGNAGTTKPRPVGHLSGAGVEAYVWPTDLSPTSVGFPAGSGILALIATAHPDFDDTPLFDENGDGNRANDGARWHTHWVVLAKTSACGPAGLQVAEAPEGASPVVPITWPGLPIMLDSPGYTPILKGHSVNISVPAADAAALVGHHFDAVTASLTVRRSAAQPLLCVTDVHKVLSGDLSLPSAITG